MKKIFIAFALCLLMVGLIACPAFAATQKVQMTNLNGNSGTGYATFITNQGDNELVVNVTLKGAFINTKYYAYLSYAPVVTDSFKIAEKFTL